MGIQKNIVYDIKDWSGQSINQQETITLSISENKANYLIHRAFIKQQQENRQGTVSTKTKSEVRGGGRKPWQQKGRGRARAGSIRSPLWRGGGVTFGPKPISRKNKLNKKEWKLSLQTLIYNKRNQFIVVENFNPLLETSKTKTLVQNLNKLVPKVEKTILLIVSENERNLMLASRNLTNLQTIQVNALNIRSLLQSNKIILSVNSLKQMQEIYAI